MHLFGKAAPKDFVPMRLLSDPKLRENNVPYRKKNIGLKKNNTRLVKTTNTEFAYFIVRSKLPVAMKFL